MSSRQHRIVLAALSLAIVLAPSVAAGQGSAPVKGTVYTLFIHEHPAELALRAATTARGIGYWTRYATLAQEMQGAGVLRGGSALQPTTAMRTVAAGGDVRETGFSSAPMPLGGYFMIEVTSIDKAVQWAQRARALGAAAVEVRTSAPSPVMR